MLSGSKVTSKSANEKSDLLSKMVQIGLDIQQSYIPLLKALKCGINAVGAQGRGFSSLLCHAHLKMGVLLHKEASRRFIMILAVYQSYTPF